MIVKTRVVGEVDSSLVDTHKDEIITSMFKQAFDEAINKIEPNPDMFFYVSLFNPMKNMWEITVDCAINVEPGKISVDTEEE